VSDLLCERDDHASSPANYAEFISDDFAVVIETATVGIDTVVADSNAGFLHGIVPKPVRWTAAITHARLWASFIAV
jgi:hypothetical protein